MHYCLLILQMGKQGPEDTVVNVSLICQINGHWLTMAPGVHV